jgi:diguanylate cyclase (GGDEF)-like protein
MKILIIDDSIEKSKIIQRILKRNLPHEVEYALSAEEGLELLGFYSPNSTSHYTIILMDVIMPGMDGIEATRLLKSSPKFEDIPILMITGANDEETIDSAFKAGAMDYISTTPIRELELLARVNSAIRLYNEMDRRKKRELELIEATHTLNKTNKLLEKISTHDPLTNLYNRRYFDSYLEVEWKNIQLNKQTLSLLMVDIDFFKPYNDEYGHQAGDSALRQVSETLAHAATRGRDVVARYGGEEFAFILPNTDIRGATFIAMNICEMIQELRIPHIHSPHSSILTVSVGVANVTYPDSEKLTQTDLISMADKALYEAKSQGRNRAVVYERK